MAAALWMGALVLPASAASLKLAWNPNPEADIANYRLSYGTASGVHSTNVNAGSATSASVSGLEEGRTYYFVVRAINTAGLESAPSSEISYQVPVLGSTPGTLVSRAGWTVHQVSSQEPLKYAAALAFDGDPKTFWHTQWSSGSATPPHEIAIDLGVVQPIGGFRYLPRQDAYSTGNIAQYEFHVSMDGVNWGLPAAAGVFANSKTEKEVLFATGVSGRYVKLRQITEVSGDNACNVAELNIVLGEAIALVPPPVESVPADPEPAPVGEVISQAGWAVHQVSSQEPLKYAAALAFDGDPKTFWHTQWSSGSATPPHEIAIDLGVVQPIGGFRYLPRQDAYSTGNIAQYEFHVSMDGVNWGLPAAAGVFANSKTEKEVLFATGVSGRYVKLRQITEVSGDNACNVAELNIVLGEAPAAAPLPPNQAPLAASQTLNIPEDQKLAVLLSATDADGDPLSYRIIGGPAMGTLSGSAPNLTYTPAPDANGTDSFTFRANDGQTDSNIATISIQVNPVNDAPVAAAQLAATSEDRPVGILLSASDKDGDPLSYRIVSSPTKGALSGTAPNLIYTPNPDANGSDSFSFRASDGTANSNTATVSIAISPVNDAPVAEGRLVSTAADTPVTIMLSASDKDGDPLTFGIVSSPAKGTLSGSPPNLTYIPNPDASGTDSFGFRASDGKASSNIATISINVTAPEKPENKAPVFQAGRIARADGKVGAAYTAETLAGAAVDPDGDAVSYSKAAGPEWLVISPAGEISGTPPTEAEGLNSFTIRAADPEGAFAEAVLEISIQSGDLPLPWSMERIGTVTEEATATGDNPSSLKVRSPGSLAGTEDSGTITWQTLSGDGVITARISSLENAGSSSRIGLIIRESLAPNAKHVFIGTDGSGTLRFIRRGTTGGSSSSSNVGLGMTPRLWLRLVRSGDSTITAFTSLDGSNWKRIAKVNVALASSCYVGLMVSGGGANPSTGIFQDVTVLP